ncbi:MAG: histidine phosphatase family protein [Desulfobulbaceae bacterium]|nr:MAG: histidine phosphatase family protein [Desulfobulbaceae bacterium]
MKTIYLLRHGEIATHSPRRFIGQTELALTDRGREQMRWIAGCLKVTDIDRLVTSPLGRCRESAGILGEILGPSPEIEPALREIAMGAWEEMTVDEVKRRFPGSYEARGRDIAIFRPPAGESFTDLSDRVWPAFLRILAGEAKSIVIIGHAGVNRVLLCRILGMPLPLLFRLRQDYACVNIIRWRDGDFKLELLNGSPAKIAFPEGVF